MNFTVERYYCLSDLGEKDDNRFLVPETIAFSKQNNPLFLAKVSYLMMSSKINQLCDVGKD